MSSSLPELADVIGPPPSWYMSLRLEIISAIQATPFIERVMAGEEATLARYLCGYWHYVGSFGLEIMRRAPGRHPEILRAIGSDATLQMIEEQQAAIRAIDRGHAELWARMARDMRVKLPEPCEAPTPAMEHLLTMMKSVDHPTFYTGLATIEAIAWALSDMASRSPLYQMVDPRWFEVHLLAHRPTHEEMYRWIAWRLLKVTAVPDPQARFEHDARGVLALFTGVADELYAAST